MKFLQGTYGIDLLSLFLLLLGSFFNMFHLTYILGLFLVILALFRVFSKKEYARKAELNKFVSVLNKLLSKFNLSIPYNLPVYNLNNFNGLFNKLDFWMKQKKQYKIIKCPICAQKLRLPRGKGAVVVTCKKCHNRFDAKC